LLTTIREHERAVLTAPVPATGLVAGDVGTIVHVYPGAAAFEVQFLMLDGSTAAVATVDAATLRRPELGVDRLADPHGRHTKIAVRRAMLGPNCPMRASSLAESMRQARERRVNRVEHVDEATAQIG
jgi:hypothetical protein